MIKKEYLKRKIRKILRYSINKENRKKLLNSNFTLISSNCIGGVISHELGLEFLSPTINMFFSASDYIKFCQNIRHYLNVPLKLIEDMSVSYPVVKCDDIILHCVHYQNLEEVQQKWQVRGSRINWDNLFFCMIERDGCTEEDIIQFNKLPYKNKVVFVHKPMPEIESTVYIPGTELNGEDGNWVLPLTSYTGRFTGKRFIDEFDYVTFFNSGEKVLKKRHYSHALINDNNNI